MIKSDVWIRQTAQQHGMIEPFESEQVKKGVVSFGCSSFGYDFRVAEEFRIPVSGQQGPVDPKEFTNVQMTEYTGADCIIAPNTYVLARTVEYFRIPRRVLALCFGKSTYARCGILLNVTPLEPEWEGYITMCIANIAPVPVKIYANEGIGQAIFLESDEDPAVSYADRKGKYQAQQSITGAKI